jgi:hypothetical protein
MMTVARRNLRLILGIIGAAVLAAGAAVPLIHVPVVGTISYLHASDYLQAGQPAAAAVIVGTAILSATLCVFKAWRWLWATGLVALAQLAATIIGFERTAAAIEMQADAPRLVDPAVMWAGALLRQAHFQWGVAVVAAGSLMILAAAAIKD